MIRIKNVSKTFNPDTRDAVAALCDVSLTIGDNEFVTIIGTNGSGKSTLLNAVAGSFFPDSGTIEINGADVTDLPVHRRAPWISRVFQDPFAGTAADMTIAENLHIASFRGKFRGLGISLNNKRLEYYKERVKMLEMQLEDRLDNKIGLLSGGQRQALTLLMAVMAKPKVLLLDEHTAALDPKSAAAVLRLTEHFIEKFNLTAIMVTHSMNQALAYGKRTIMMNKGGVMEDIDEAKRKSLTPDDLLEKFARIRKSEQMTPDLFKRLVENYV